MSLLAVYPLSKCKVVTPSYRNRGWYLLCLSDRSAPVRAPLSSYPGQYKFRVWVRKNPLSVTRFVDLAAIPV